MPAKKLFVSHAVADQPLAKAFVELLEGGIGVPPKDIFCSSLKGQGIKPGVDFKSSIRTHLDGALLVVGLITPNFYQSSFCMCELGGAWIQAKNFLPVLVPPLKFADLRAVLEGLHTLRVDDEGDLDDMRDDVADRAKIALLATARWSERRDKFLAELPKIVEGLPRPNSVAQAAHGKVLKELDDYKAALKEANTKIEELDSLCTELKSAKDATTVATIIQKHSTAIANFERLVEAAKRALRPVDTAATEALYYRTRGEEYYPREREEWDNVQRSIENGQLAPNADQDGVSVVEDDPKVQKAITAVDSLESFLEDPPSEFLQWYKAKFGENAKITLRPFWERHLGL